MVKEDSYSIKWVKLQFLMLSLVAIISAGPYSPFFWKEQYTTWQFEKKLL